MKKVAIIGIQGVPAKYGGFETLVENMIGENTPSDIQYTVFCSSKDYEKQMKVYKGAVLKYIPFFHANGIQSTPYDIYSLMKVIKGYDTILVLGVSGCIFLPFFRMLCHKQLIINIDGIEHRRAKWGKFARKFLKYSEARARKSAEVIIADNKGIQEYVKNEYGKETVLIAYGGDHVQQTISSEQQYDILNHYNLSAGEYAITICRIEPENNCHLILEAFAQSNIPMIFIGNWERSEYGKDLKKKYISHNNIKILDPIYDLQKLYALRKNCKYYIHGHSAGGTNPSLVEAMFFGVPILAYDVIYNRETTQKKACYFQNEKDLLELTQKNNTILQQNAKDMLEIANRNYKWETIANQYSIYY